MNTKMLLSVLAVTLASVLVETDFAQSAPPQMPATAVMHSGRVRNPASIKKAKLTRLRKEAGLDEQQLQAVAPIIDSYLTSVQEVKNNRELDSRARRLKLSELRQRYDSDISALLTPDQQQKLASAKAERRARLRGTRTSSEPSQASEVSAPAPLSTEVH